MRRESKITMLYIQDGHGAIEGVVSGRLHLTKEMTHRLVVPSAFVELLLAEHTTATLCSERLGLCI